MNNSFSSMDDTEAGTSSGRMARNLAEKHRRDKLNASIHELSTMVPHVAESTRRLDKTAVLRFAAHGLRLRHVFGKSSKKLKGLASDKEASTRPLFTETLMQLLDSFLITLTCHGQIVVISSSVEQLLGHCQSDLYGQNLMHITHPEDQTLLKQQLIPNDLERLFRLVQEDYLERDDRPFQSGDHGSTLDDDVENEEENCCRSPSPRTLAHQEYIDQCLREDRRCFTVRLARAGTRSESARSYEIVKIDGCFRRSDCTPSTGNYPIVSQLIRRARGQHVQHDAIAQAALHGISGNDIVLVAMCRLIRPPKVINRILETNNLEYRTRHLIDGQIIDCDQRIGLVAGYMKDEVRNLSPFSFMHQDDVRWVIVALRQMYDCNSDYGESCYRLLSRNGHFIYLQTRGFLEIDKNTNKVHSFVCVNTLLSEEEGKRKVQEMKNKFSAIINTKIPTSSLLDVPASQNPQQLEKIVLCLIENLQKRHELEGNYISASNFVQVRNTKTPPLALVAPEASKVKSSISKSVNVVNVTAAKTLLAYNVHKSPSVHSEMSLSPASSTEADNNPEDYPDTTTRSTPPSRPSILKLGGPSFDSYTSTSSSIIVYNTKMTDERSASNRTSISESTSSNPTSPTNTAVSPNFHPATQMLHKQISVLKRLHASAAAATTPVNGDNLSPAKRPISESQESSTARTTSTTDIHNVISTSLKNIDHTLDNICNETIALCDQHAPFKPHVPPAINQKLDEIIVEHQKQKEILVNIKSEYDVQLVQQQDMLEPSVQLSRFAPSASATHGMFATNTLILNNNNNNNNLKIGTLTTTQRKPR